MPEMSAQFDFWGGSTIGSTRTVPVRQGNEVVAPTKRRSKKDPEQLPMFMSGREIKAVAAPGDTPMGGGENTWQYKRANAMTQKAGVYGDDPRESLGVSIRKSGVRRPVDIMWDQTQPDRPATLVQGHHRVAMQEHVDPDRLIPVVHHPPTKHVGRLAGVSRVEDAIRSARQFGWRDIL